MLNINTEAIDAINEGRDTPSFLYDNHGQKAFHLRYKSTDGWRGYYYTTALKKAGWKKIDYEGWVTGNWSDAPTGHSSNEVEDKLNAIAEDYKQRGYEVTAVFAPTSNVFSTAFDVFIKKLN